MNDRLSAQYWLHEKELTTYSSEAVRDRRRSAMERFEAVGFPTVRDEDWKYSSLKPGSRRTTGCARPVLRSKTSTSSTRTSNGS